MYPIVIPPKRLPNIAQSAASAKLNFIASVPNDPTTMLFKAIPILKYMSSI
jgi:hypothetical protein